MSSVGLDSLNSSVSAAEASPVSAPRERGIWLSGTRAVVLSLSLMTVFGLGLRLIGLGTIGFAEDEINKVEAVRAYDHGDFTVNAEHPMMMKLLMDLSMRGARVWSSLTGAPISEEAAVRFPNVLFGALTAVPLFLLTAALFDRRAGLLVAMLWSVGINAITYNRIGKEDTLMVFFLLLGFYFFIRAKQVIEQPRLKRMRNLSGISFGLMMAAKYFPHYFGLNMLYHHFYRMRERSPSEARWITPFSFFVLIAVAFIIANPAVLSPHVWNYLNAYSGEKLLTYTGYVMGDRIYKNTVSSSPFWGLPLYFYFLFLAIKVPLVILGTFIIGVLVSTKHWRKPGYGFVLFMLFFWLVPYSLFGSKWLRYTLALMPFVYMSAAVGALALLDLGARMLDRYGIQPRYARGFTALFLAGLILWPAWTAYANAPHYALYTNTLGRGYTAYFFPHDEFYDDGMDDAIQYVCEHASAGAMIVSETPAVVRYYVERSGRTDLQSHVLSDPKFLIDNHLPAYYILERGRTYFENQDKMKYVRENFTLAYAGCVKGHTAVEVYTAPADQSAAVQPCGDLRP